MARVQVYHRDINGVQDSARVNEFETSAHGI